MGDLAVFRGQGSLPVAECEGSAVSIDTEAAIDD